jgi:mycothiol synthase
MNVGLRAPRVEEAGALADLVNRVSGELFGEREETEESIRLWLTSPDLDPETDARVLERDGEFVGYADLGAYPDPRYWADLRVPVSEEDEVRAALFAWLEQRAQERAAGREEGLLRFAVWSMDEPAKLLLERAGYLLIRHSYRMRIDFERDLPEPEWPGGLTVGSASDADAKAVYEAHQESFEDSWEHVRDPFEEWEHWMMRYEGFDPTLWFVAEDDGEIAGVSLCRAHEAEEGLGWVRVLGVRRPWRKRGLGRALLLHSFHEFRRRGLTAVGLGVDAESLTGANRLYENAGMRVVRRSDIYEKNLRS